MILELAWGTNFQLVGLASPPFWLAQIAEANPPKPTEAYEKNKESIVTVRCSITDTAMQCPVTVFEVLG